MRPLLHGDISSAARALLHAPPSSRRRLCARMIHEAEQADRYFRRNGRVHPVWGNGSLMSAARKRTLADEPGFDNVEYCRCLTMVLRGLIAHQAGTRRR